MKLKKSQWIKIFYFLQKTLNGFRKFIFHYRIRYKTKIYNDNTLLLDNFKQNDPILYLYDFHNKNNNNVFTCYKFNASELFNICEKNIVSYDEFLMYDTIDLKNPYNNISFTKSQLCNIYFFLRCFSWKCIPLYTLYFSCNFDKSFFILKHDNSLRDHVINDFYKSLTKSEKIIFFNRIIELYYPVKLHYREINLSIYNDFFNAKKHLIYDYLIYKYSYNKNLSNYHLSQIDREFRLTYNINPMLGRKIKNYSKNHNSSTYIVSNGNNTY